MAATLDKGTNNIDPKMKVLFAKEKTVLEPVKRKNVKRIKKR